MELVLWERCVISANNAQLFTDKIRHVTCACWRGSSARPSASEIITTCQLICTTLLYFVSEKIDLVAVDLRNSLEKGHTVLFITLQDGGWDEKSDP